MGVAKLVGVMAYVHPGGGALDYAPCRYGTSRVMFRGPARALESPYVAVLGGTETYGKFVPDPYPAVMEAETGLRMVNLGAVNAGLDVYLKDPALLDIAHGAQVVVVQVVGAQNLSNRFYQVHRRRNDRFLGATAALKDLYPEVDFTEFSFTRHMLLTLQRVSAERFERVAEELRHVWSRRMTQLLQKTGSQTLLLWFAFHKPPRPGAPVDLTRDPILVDAAMLAKVRPLAAAYVEAVASPSARAEGLEGMAFTPLEEPAAMGVPGPAAHQDLARKLAQAIRGLPGFGA